MVVKNHRNTNRNQHLLCARDVDLQLRGHSEVLVIVSSPAPALNPSQFGGNFENKYYIDTQNVIGNSK